MRQPSLVTGQHARCRVISRVGNQARKRQANAWQAQRLVKDAIMEDG